jgi:putative transposase
VSALQNAYPATLLCDLLGLARSSWYYQTAPGAPALRTAVTEVAMQVPTYGSRRLAAQLRRPPYQLTVNRKRAQRLMRELGLLRRPKAGGRQTTQRRHRYGRFPNLVAERVAQRPDEIWVADITYIRLRGQFIY